MVKKRSENKSVKKKVVKKKNVKENAAEEEESDSGVSLDDAFADDEDVEYGQPKPKKAKKKKKGEDEEELEEDLNEAENGLEEIEKMQNGGQEIESKGIEIKASKPIASIKKGDKMWIDGREYEVDAHYVMIDHGKTKEMAIELFDSSSDKDYQLRYFMDQVETSLEFYELQEILYLKRQIGKVEW